MSLTTPGVTVVEQPINEIGAQSSRRLLRCVAGDGRPPETIVLEQRLVERDLSPPRRAEARSRPPTLGSQLGTPILNLRCASGFPTSTMQT